MKIAQFIHVNSPHELSNKSFQKELWDLHWSTQSTDSLINQLRINPLYWNLLSLVKKKDKILEAGCGFGQWVISLKRQGFNILGIDIAANTIQMLKKNYPDLKVYIADVEDLPFKDKSFNVYLSFGVIEHFRDGPQKVLREARRVLKKDGLLYLTVPYLNIPRFVKYKLLENPKGEFYQYLYSKGDIIKLIEKAGFKIDKVKNYDFINAIKKDMPFGNSLIKLISKNKNNNPKYVTPSQFTLGNKPNFILQEILYRLDSYIILIEAYKK